MGELGTRKTREVKLRHPNPTVQTEDVTNVMIVTSRANRSRKPKPSKPGNAASPGDRIEKGRAMETRRDGRRDGRDGRDNLKHNEERHRTRTRGKPRKRSKSPQLERRDDLLVCGYGGWKSRRMEFRDQWGHEAAGIGGSRGRGNSKSRSNIYHDSMLHPTKCVLLSTRI
jgi:hypothetical protein